MGIPRPIEPEDYLWKTDPYTHQREQFLRTRDLPTFAYLMGMGTGKSKIVVDVAAWNYQQGNINCLLIVAPNGVHDNNWIGDQILTHMPEWTQYVSFAWHNDMKVKERKQFERLFDPDLPGLRVVAMNIEAFQFGTTQQVLKTSGRKKAHKDRLLTDYTAHGIVKKLCDSFKVLLAIDESSKIKTPGSKRTKNLCTLGKGAVMRRILTGTPVTNSPLDIYSQFMFLDPDILGFDNFYTFKHFFAEWKKTTVYDPRKKEQREFEELVGFRNMEKLLEIIEPYSYRITKEECVDLPEKIYQNRYFEMSGEQRRLYNQIVKKSLYEIEGERFAVASVLTKLLRLQQVLGGFIPRDKFAPAEAIEGPNPRLECMMDIVEEAEGKVIIWSRFRAEIAAIEEALRSKYGRQSVVSYHGGVVDEDRTEAVIRFQGVRPIVDPQTHQVVRSEPVPVEDQARFFVGQPHSGGYGLTLHAATTVIYYSNDFSLEARLQSEDRAHRIGQHHPVNYVDIECLGTVDSKIIAALRAKLNVADIVTQDSVRLLLAQKQNVV